MKKTKIIKNNVEIIAAKKKVNEIKEVNEIDYDTLNIVVNNQKINGYTQGRIIAKTGVIRKKKKAKKLNFLPLDDDFPERSDK